jgi:Zn finger protein HypA/HybF involved in hydrogenase expression
MADPLSQLNCMECKAQLPNELKNDEGKLQITCPKCGTTNNLIESGSKDDLVRLRPISIEK